MGQPKLASASMPRRVAPVAACVVAVLAAIVQASTDDCSGLTSSSTCLADEYCAWIVTLETDTYISSCTSCDSLATSEARCLENCAYYDADTEYCGPEPPTPAPTLSPLETTAPYVASEGLMVFNMDRASSISSSMQTSIEDAIVESLGANAVYLYSIESDSSCGEAPLCGDDPVMISSVSNWSAPVILPELSQCCPLEDTVTTDDCQTIDLSTGACRSVGLVEAFCEDVENGDSERCAALREPEAYNATLNLIVGFVEAGTESTCCKQCTCYGDPHCVSFNGTETSWRLCDGRDTRTEKECSITKFACKDRVDHTGKACKWKQDWSSNWHDGSPCQVDTNSDVSSITMYEADTFGFSITQRERGVIRSVNMTTANGTFYLSASACISGTDLDSWVWSDGDMSDAPSWTSSWSRVTTTSSFDVLWYIADGNTGIMAVIRCTGTRNPKKSNKYGNYRINVESLIEPDEFTERTNLGGFCYNDVLVDSSDKYALESYTEHLAIEAVCAIIQPAWSEELALNYTSLLCGAGYTANSLDDCFVAFCNAYSFPNVDAEDCITLFANRELAEGFCSVTSSLESARSKCVNNINDFGYEDIITDYLSTASTSSNGTCANSTEELPTSLNDCQSGVTLQYEDEDGTWTDYLAIPESYPLCNGQLSISAISHPLLFTSAIRIVQCSNDGSCGTTTQCNAISGVDARFHFEVDYLLPTAAPVVGTPAPTNINPTPSPTIRGSTTAPVTTPGVTPSPTRSPTTPSPTSPTKAPTAQPTTRGKTNEPTFHPSGPTSPTTPSPTPTPSDSRNLTPSPSDSSTSSSQAPTASPTGDTYDSGDEENPYDSSEGTRSPTMEGETRSPTKRPTTLSPTVEGETRSPTTDDYGESPYDSQTYSPTVEGETRSPTKRPTTLSPTVEGETRSPTTDDYGESPYDSQTYSPTVEGETRSPTKRPTTLSPTVEGETRSPTTDDYGESPYDSQTYSPTVEGETRSPTKRPTTLSPTVEGETRSPTTDDYGESPYDSQTYSPTVEGETRSPTKRPTTLSPTVEGETRSPTTDDYGESPYDSQTYSPTVEGETRSPTTDDYGESPYDSQTYSPTVEGETRSPTKRPTTLSPTVEGETRSPTESDDYTANEEAYDSHTPSPTTEESEWQYTEDEGYGYSILSQRTSAPNSGGRRRRQLYQKRFQYEAVNPSLLVNIPARPRTLIGNSLELRSGNSNRRKLDTTRPYNEVRVIFYALFEDNSDEESISSEVASSSSDFTSSIATELNAKSGFANVDVGYIGLSPTYKYGGLSFPIAYDSSKQSTSTFLSAVCKALAKTISKLTSLSNVNCGTKLLDFRAVEDSNGDLVVAFRMLNVKQGVIQKMLNTNKGQNVLKAQLAASDIDYVQVLSAAMPSYDEDEGASTGMIIGIAVGGGVGIAALFVGTALFIRRRRSQKPRLADDENLWNMVSYLADKNNKPISVTEAVGADADEKK